MRADQDCFAGSLRGREGGLDGGDFLVYGDDEGREGGCDAVVELGDGFAAGGGVEDGGVGGLFTG